MCGVGHSGSGGKALKYVYLLRSTSDLRKTYIGLTEDFRRRLQEHNEGKSRHTSKWRPWKMVVCMAFADDKKAAEFEEYLKVGSGHAFARRHFW